MTNQELIYDVVRVRLNMGKSLSLRKVNSPPIAQNGAHMLSERCNVTSGIRVELERTQSLVLTHTNMGYNPRVQRGHCGL